MEVTPFAVAKLLSGLVDRPVQMARAESPVFSPKTVFALYDVEPNRQQAVVKIDLGMLALFAGIMIGLPAKQVETQVKQGTLDEDMQDCSREVMNVLSSVVVAEGRAVFRQLITNETELPAESRKLLTKGFYSRLSLKCTVSAQPAGFMTIVSTA